MAFKLYIITAMLWLVLTRRNSVGYIIDLWTYPFSEKKCYAMFTINKKKLGILTTLVLRAAAWSDAAKQDYQQ